MQDLLVSLDLLGLFKGALYKISSQDLYERSLNKSSLYKISSQDPHMRHLYTRSPDIPGPPRSLHRSSLQDLFTRPLWGISLQELSTSLHKTSMRDLFARALYKISSRDPIWDISMQDLRVSLGLLGLFTGALYKISSQDLYERSLCKSSRRDFFTRPLWEIPIQELSTRSLHRTHIWDIFIQDLLISLDLLGLFPGAPYKISSQDFHDRSLYKSSLTSPGMSGPPRSLHRSSLQDLFTNPIREISLQELSKISWYPWTS